MHRKNPNDRNAYRNAGKELTTIVNSYEYFKCKNLPDEWFEEAKSLYSQIFKKFNLVFCYTDISLDQLRRINSIIEEKQTDDTKDETTNSRSRMHRLSAQWVFYSGRAASCSQTGDV